MPRAGRRLRVLCLCGSVLGALCLPPGVLLPGTRLPRVRLSLAPWLSPPSPSEALWEAGRGCCFLGGGFLLHIRPTLSVLGTVATSCHGNSPGPTPALAQPAAKAWSPRV